MAEENFSYLYYRFSGGYGTRICGEVVGGYSAGWVPGTEVSGGR